MCAKGRAVVEYECVLVRVCVWLRALLLGLYVLCHLDDPPPPTHTHLHTYTLTADGITVVRPPFPAPVPLFDNIGTRSARERRAQERRVLVPGARVLRPVGGQGLLALLLALAGASPEEIPGQAEQLHR